MKEKLIKTGRKKDNRFLRRSLIFSVALTLVSLSTFIPLIASGHQENIQLAQTIDDTEQTIENLVRHNHLVYSLED